MCTLWLSPNPVQFTRNTGNEWEYRAVRGGSKEVSPNYDHPSASPTRGCSRCRAVCVYLCLTDYGFSSVEGCTVQGE